MNTPIYDFVTEYMNSGISRLHMPGHKGRGPLGVEARDVTEIRGADVLCEAEGIIGESEANATVLFGSGHSFYSTEGSSLAIRAMLFLALQYARTMPDPRPVVLAARNAHKAFLYACALLDCDIEWIWPEDTDLNSVCACHPTPDQITSRLRAMDRRPFAVYLTSPDYLGTLADVRGITEAVRDAKIPVLVDNAHGAYLHFLPESLHPLDLGAFMTCDSAHKTLPVLTGGAYLQVSNTAMDLLGPEIRPALSLFASTSPSYLILQSLDLCNAYLADGYRERLAGTIARADALKASLRAAGVPVLDSEPLKLVIDASGAGSTCREAGSTCGEAGGALLAEVLRASGVEPEFADANYLVLMLTP
ncbi:MAG: amino acid decarboxylase, partial [Stomatobaculum sp.]|nr:amino acid decarboxylase [Stomatobaculum sp.]